MYTDWIKTNRIIKVMQIFITVVKINIIILKRIYILMPQDIYLEI